MNQPLVQADAPAPVSTPPPAPAAPPVTSQPIVCWVGLDWADKKHVLAVRTAANQPGTIHQVEQTPQALEDFFLELRRQHPEGRIAIALEQSRGPVLYALLQFAFLAIYPVNPRTLADYRRAFKVSGAKDDPLDAQLLSELVALHPDRLRALAVEEPCIRRLRLLTEDRRTFVQDGTLLSNRLGQTLKCYYPLALELIGEKLTSPMALEFLRRWPNLAKLKAAKPATLRAFFYKQNSRSEDRISERLAALEQARPLTEDPALLEPLQQRMESLVAQLSSLAKVVEHYDAEIRRVFKSVPQAHLFADLPGAGPALAPRLAAAFGTIQSNFPTVEDVLSFSGVAPVRIQSGATERVHFRYARPIFLHQSFVEFAKCSLPKCEWARLLYDHELKQGKKKWVALRKIAFKWIRILWRCWRDGKAYDETTYLRSLQRDGVALYESLYEQLPPLPTSVVNNS